MKYFFDINGNPRFLDDAVDIGAYETQAFQTYTSQVQNVSCNGNTDGSILWAQHGTPPFINNWDNGIETGIDFNNLVAGNYNITVTDADNCIGNFNSIITEPMPIEISGIVNDASSMAS